MDDDEWEDWMSLSDAEQRRIVEAEERKLAAALARLTDEQKQRLYIRQCLERSTRWAHLIAQRPDFPFLRDERRKVQRRLLKLRIWKQTGVYPGEA